MTSTVPNGWGNRNKSPYSQVSHHYLERGMPVIPVSPGTKMPGAYDGGEWKTRFGWQGYANRMPTETEADIWSAWPDGGICLPLGGISQLICVDIDTDDPALVAALEHELAGLLICRRRGRKGYAAFMYAPDDLMVDRSTWNVGGQRVVDLLHTGRQVVLPPTVHPSGMRYEWITDVRLEDVDPGDLPTCPADICERITRAVEPFLTDADRRLLIEQQQRKPRGSATADTEFRDANNKALASLASWVPALFPDQDLQRGADGGFRVRPFWRGVTDAHKCSIHPDGIKDFGQDDRLTPLDLVMKVRGGTIKDAMDWLCPLIGIARTTVFDLAALESRFSPEFFSPAAENKQEAPPVIVARTQSLTDELGLGNLAAESVPPALLNMPGMGQTIVQYILGSAISPQPLLAMQAALAYGATMMGRIYAGPTGLRSNLYLLGVARSGFGKDHPQKCLAHLVSLSGLAPSMGTGFRSGAALLSKLQDPAAGGNLCYALDEMQQYLRLSRDAGNHGQETLDMLLELFSQSNNPSYIGRDYADRKAKAPEPIACPSLTLLGNTTPESFADSASSKQIASGLLGRFIVAHCGDTRPPKNRKALPMTQVPDEIIEWGKIIRRANSLNGPAGEELRGLSPTAPKIISWEKSGSAERRMWEFDDEICALADNLSKKIGDRADIIARWQENALKVAMIMAGFQNPHDPVINIECVEYAIEYVRYFGMRFLSFVVENVGDSEGEVMENKIMATLIKHGERGLTRRELGLFCRSFLKMSATQREQWIAAQVRGGVLAEVVAGRRRALVALADEAVAADT